MNVTSTTKTQKVSKIFMLMTAVWCSAIMPVMPSYAKMLTANELPNLNSSLEEPENNLERSLAETSKTAATYLSENQNTKEFAELAQNYAYNQAANAAIEEITQWLSQAGNAKLSLNLDKQLSLKNSQFDWLIPWYDQADTLLFTQHSIHHTDNRLQTNHGIGVRHFTDHNMVGVNTFFDHDLSRYHSRVGLGAEYWQDYVRLSTNAYLPISSWRSATELAHKYDARPARGWDIQAQSWLPMYPNIGGNIKFEQYFGDDVALMGKDHRQKDPMATTLGLNWTPFPLMTLSADHKMSAKLSETSGKVQFTWAFDKSFAEQIDPSRVAETRLYSGNRHDFVQRNNNIVLEYQKKKTFQLALPQTIRGETGQQLPLVKSLTSEFPLKKIVWNAPELLVAGGTISSSDQNATVKLPAYKKASTLQQSQQLNRYRVSAVAYDINGNTSPSMTTFVEVFDSKAIFIQANDKAPQGKKLANGTDVNRVSLIVKNANGMPVPNTQVTFTLPPELTLAAKGAFQKKMQPMKAGKHWKYEATTNSHGEAEVLFTTKVAGAHQISAITSTGQKFSQVLHFTLDVHQANIRDLVVIKSGALADGKSQNIVKAYITDGNGKPVANQTVNFEAISGKIAAQGTSNKDGIIEIPITSTHVGNATIIAKLNGEEKTTSVEFVKVKLARIEIMKIASTLSGMEPQIELKLTDSLGKPFVMPNQTVTVMASIDNVQYPVIVTEAAFNTGLYFGELPGQMGGDHTVAISYNNITSQKQTYTVASAQYIKALNSDGSGPKGTRGVLDSIDITLQSTNSAKVGQDLKVTITAKDAFNHELEGIDPRYIQLNGNSFTTLGWADDGYGDYISYITPTKSGNFDISATINGISSSKVAIQVKP